MTQSPEEVSPVLPRRFPKLRSVRWRIDLRILPSSQSSSVDELRRVAADTRRRYASLRRRLLIDPHIWKNGDRSPDPVIDNPLSQNPESTWGRFFKNAELEKTVDQDLSRLYPEHGSYFQTSACQSMLRRILLIWCLRHPEYGYRQGMHELLAPLVYVLHVDLDNLSQVRDLCEDYFNDDFDGMSFPGSDFSFNDCFGNSKNSDSDTKKNDCSRSKVRSLDDLDNDTKDIFLLSDPYGAEGELGVILSDRFMEHDAFCMFDALMNGTHGVVAMADFFSPSVQSSTSLPPVIEASSALYHLLSVVDSSLHGHLVELGVEPQYFALRWLRVLFGREFCLEDLLLIWDELFSCSNDVCIDTEMEYNFKVLRSQRGAFIAALAVSILLHLRSSLLATENPTYCLQRLLNFPEKPDMKKLIGKAKSLQALAIDSNIAPSSKYMSNKNTLTVNRGYSLPSGSPKTPVNPVLESYWEEKWRDLHKSEALQKGSNNLNRRRTVKRFLGERFGLLRTESSPSPSTVSGVKDRHSSVIHRLLDDLSQDIKPAEDHFKSEPSNGPTILHKTDSLPLTVNVGHCFAVESTDQNIIVRTSDCVAEVTCLSGENSAMISRATSPHSHHETDSEKSSVTSISFVDNDDGEEEEEEKEKEEEEEVEKEKEEEEEVEKEKEEEEEKEKDEEEDEEKEKDEETCELEGPSSAADNQIAEESDIPAPTNAKHAEEKEESPKERKNISGRFQWFWKFARGSGDVNLEKGGSKDTEKSSAARNACGGNLGTSGSVDAFNSCVSGKTDVGDKKVTNTWKNLGQSMLENIQVIETVFQQDWGCQSASLENLSNNILGGKKRQATAMAALKELRKISNILSEM